MDSSESLLTSGEKDIIFDACSVEDGQASVLKVESLCEAIEREMLSEN